MHIITKGLLFVKIRYFLKDSVWRKMVLLSNFTFLFPHRGMDTFGRRFVISAKGDNFYDFYFLTARQAHSGKGSTL